MTGERCHDCRGDAHLKRGSQNPYIEEGQTKADKKGQKDKPRSTKHQSETKKSLKILMWVIRIRRQTMMDKTLHRK
jgi:hypothetical protein